MTFTGVNYLAILVAAIVGWVIGAAWYMALAKPWVDAHGRTMEDFKARGGRRARARPPPGCPTCSPSSPS